MSYLRYLCLFVHSGVQHMLCCVVLYFCFVFLRRLFLMLLVSLDCSLVIAPSVFSNVYSNMTSFFRFVNKRASYPFGIILIAHARVNVTDFSIGSLNCVRHFPQK